MEKIKVYAGTTGNKNIKFDLVAKKLLVPNSNGHITSHDLGNINICKEANSGNVKELDQTWDYDKALNKFTDFNPVSKSFGLLGMGLEFALKKRKQVMFMCELNDGSRFLGSTDRKSFTILESAAQLNNK